MEKEGDALDNFHIDITAEGRDTLMEALVIAFRHNAPGGKVTHWAELAVPDHEGGLPTGRALVLLWHEETPKVGDPPMQRFPVPLDAAGALGVVERWLDAADRGNEPDHDGSNGEGFRVFCEGWGHVRGYHYAVVGISPTWAWYGK
jgi:hypothetical protein